MQDIDQEDYVVKLLGSPDRPTHALCGSCKEVKPIKDFKTMSTNAQAKAWGYNRAIEITSNNCKICRPPKKKVADMTLKELQNKIMAGDIKGGAIGNMLKEDKIAEVKRKKREASITRWAKERKRAWHLLLAESTSEHDRIRKNKSNTTRRGYNKQPVLYAFLESYQEALVNVRAMFILEKEKGTLSPDTGKAWWQYIPAEKREELHGLWLKIPFGEVQNHMCPVIFQALVKTKLTKGEPQ